jgi:hypothetical protein
MRDALCARRTYEGDPFFDTKPTEDVRLTTCVDCPVAWDCVSYAIRRGIDFGVWGAMNENERRRLVQVHPRLDGHAQRGHASHIKKLQKRRGNR